jgi:hypothetical protein
MTILVDTSGGARRSDGVEGVQRQALALKQGSTRRCEMAAERFERINTCVTDVEEIRGGTRGA